MRLEQRHRDWIAAVESTDIDVYADLVTEDVVWIPPHGQPVVGRPAFRSWLEPFFSRYTYQSEVDDVRAYETGGWIAESGTVTSHMTPRSGGPVSRHSSRYFMLWRRDGERWRIDRYIDTANLQPGTAAS